MTNLVAYHLDLGNNATDARRTVFLMRSRRLAVTVSDLRVTSESLTGAPRLC